MTLRGANGTTTLTKQDLRGFDSESTELILWAQEQGARIKISNRNHAVLYAPDGQTACVPRKLKRQARSARNARAGVRRIFR